MYASIKGSQHVKLRGSDNLLKKIQNEKKVLDEAFRDLADPTMDGSMRDRGKYLLKNKKYFFDFFFFLGPKPPTRRGMGLRSSGGVRASMMQLKNSVFS